MIELAGKNGYAAVTVRDLTRLAGVSTRSFYEHFGDKEECFLSTYEWLARRAARRMVGSQKAGQDWRQHLHLGLRRFVHDVAAEPKAAHLLLIEASAIGLPALARMSRTEAIFEAVLNTSLSQASEEEMPPPFAARTIVSGATRVARARLLAGHAEELPEVVDELTEWALSYACADVSADCRGQSGGPANPFYPAPNDRWEGQGQVRSRRDPRALVLAAVAKLVAKQGYEALSPPRIRAAAGVSRKAFDAHFEGVHDCYLAAIEELSTDAIAEALYAGANGQTWPAAVYRTVAVFCERIGHDRTFASLIFAEGVPPGPNGMRLRERLIAIVAQRLHSSAPPGRRPSKLAAEASIGAAWDAIHRQVGAGRTPRLSQQANRLTFLLLAPAIGGDLATNTIRAEDERISELSRSL